MNASELRIGNLVKNWDIEGLGQETIIGEVHTIEANDFPHWAEVYDPIPLSEKWLKSFGFVNEGYDLLFWTIQTKAGAFEISGLDGDGFGVRYNDKLDVELNYVHQLQNLFHALTGEELTIKEKAA